MSLLNQNLIAFMAIVRQGTVHAAAKEIGITQTGVTQRIRSIERELKTTLFTRSRRGMKLTVEGEALLRYCKASEDLEGEVLGQIKGTGVDRPVQLTIVGPTSIMNARIVDQCLPLFKEWPLLLLNFQISDAPDRLHFVRTGKAFFAIVPSEQVPNEMDSKVLKPEKFVLVASSKWKGRRFNDILENERIIDFEEDDMTSFTYLKKFDLLSKVKNQRLFAGSNEAIMSLFIHGIGYGTLTQEVAKPYLENGSLILLNGGAALEEQLALVWYPRPEMPGYLKAIVKRIK